TIVSFSNRQRPLKIVPPPKAFLVSAVSLGGTLFLLTSSFPSAPLATKAKDIGFVFACFKALARSVSAMVTLQGVDHWGTPRLQGPGLYPLATRASIKSRASRRKANPSN